MLHQNILANSTGDEVGIWGTSCFFCVLSSISISSTSILCFLKATALTEEAFILLYFLLTLPLIIIIWFFLISCFNDTARSVLNTLTVLSISSFALNLIVRYSLPRLVNFDTNEVTIPLVFISSFSWADSKSAFGNGSCACSAI